MDPDAYTTALNAHYGSSDLAASLFAALQDAGTDLNALTLDDLAVVDQFHTGGMAATLALIRLAEIRPGSKVLDIGGGLGGTARVLAHQVGCTVTVLDLTEAYCQAGRALTARVGLSDLVDFHHGSALEVPFAEESFDLVWTQHMSMNVADKAGLYAEIRRVLRPGGRHALHEVMAGPVQPLHFPVPWTRDPALSFLRSPTEIRALLAAAGLVERAWVDVTPWTMALGRAQTALHEVTPTQSPLHLELLVGPEAPEMRRTLARNFAEDRAVVIQAVFDRS